MADSNHSRRDDFLEFSENDPFAELTRIMGHDPRAEQSAAPAQSHGAAVPSAEDFDLDFDIDLERELAADLDLSVLDEPAPQADWHGQEPADQPVAIEAVTPEQVELDSEFDAFFAEEIVETQPVAASYEASQPDMPSGMTGLGEDGFADALEQELLAQQASWPEPEPEPAYEMALSFEEQAPAPLAAEPEVTENDWAVEAEFDVDFLERELAAATPPAQAEFESQYEAPPPPPASFEAEPFGEPEEYAAIEPVEQVVDDSVDRPLSLEEELHLLLADEPQPTAPPVAAQPAVAAAAGFGRANFSAISSAPVPAPAPAVISSPAFVPAPTAELSQNEVNPVETASEAYQQPAEVEVPEAVAAVADDGFDNIFGDDFVLNLDDESVDEAQAYSVEASAPELPDIETVEVAETVPSATDDLDIPEIDYGAATASAPDFHDDFQSDFDHLFGEVTTGEAKSSVAASIEEPVAAGQPAPYDNFLDNMQWQAEPAAEAAGSVSDSGYDYETDLEQAIAMSAYEEQPAEPSSRRRGLFVAAAVGGIVVLGAAGIFGMSMFGGGSDSPAIVRADPGPMKVRPENPGGTTVPNQDNEVYQRVSGTGSDAGPVQEQLITSAEEPVDIVARTVTPQESSSALAPGVDDSAEETGLVKSEDRIEPTPQATSPVEAAETAMVTPRRVRTMVVRPDGTMVPREEPAATPEPATAGQPVTTGEATALAPMEQPVQPSDEIDDGPTIEMPETVSVVPTQRSQAPQPVAATPQPSAPQPVAPTQQIAAAPVAAPTAATAASEWSMQIASQPTAEGAQASYQDLARRYGSVLEGRGVNIVRADIDGRGTYYRVRIPASSRDEAIQLCTRYKAVGGSCFVSR